MDVLTQAGLALAAVAIGSYLGTKIMLKYPGTRVWLQNQAIAGYNYLDKHKAEVPAEFMPAWEAAYKACDDAVDAFADDELTWAETKRLGLDAIAAVNAIRKIIGK